MSTGTAHDTRTVGWVTPPRILCHHCGQPMRRPDRVRPDAERHYCASHLCQNAYERWRRAVRKERAA